MTSPQFRLPEPDIGPWRAGNTGTEGVWRFDSGVPGRQVMLAALVHGNELCGAWALRGLLQAQVRPRRGTLTLAFCNLAAFDRFTVSDWDASRFVDEDLNRQWLPDRIALGDTVERRRAQQLLPFVQQADWLLDLHSMHEPGEPLLLAGLQPRNLALARALRAPGHVVVDAGHKDGARMRDFGRFGMPDAQSPETRSLLVECGFHGDESSRDVARDLCARFLVEAGTLDPGDVRLSLGDWRRPDAPRQWLLRVTDGVVARSERFRFARRFEGLALIPRAGTLVGDNDGDPVTTPYDDCVLVMPSVRQARAGVTVVRFATRQAL